MKKFYSIFVMMLLAFTAVSAKTLTVKVDNPTAVYLLNLSDYSYPQFTDGQASVTLSSEYSSFNIYANSGYEITEVKIDGVNKELSTPSYCEVIYSEVQDGSVVEVSTDKQKDKTLYIVGDATKVKVTDLSSNTLGAEDQIDGKWEIVVPAGSYSSVEVDALDGYMISSAMASDGKNYCSSLNDYFYVSASELTAQETTVTVETISLDDLYPNKINVNVDGEGYYVSFRLKDQYNSQELNKGANVVRYNAETDVPFTISHAYNSSYNPQRIYGVKINGVSVDANDDWSFTVTPTGSEDDVIDIQVEAPEVEIPITFTFKGDARAAVSNMYMNNQNVLKENWDSFIGLLGKSLSFRINTEGYDVTEFTLNGEPQEDNGYGYYSVNCGPETGMNFVIDAKAKPGIKVTVICENYQGLLLGKDYNCENVYELTGEESVIEVLPGDNYIYYKAADGYLLKDVYDLNNNHYSSSIYVTGEMTLCFEVEKFDRNETAVVFIEDTQWQYFRMAIAANNYNLTKEYSFDNGNISTGYNFIPFNEETDCPFGFSTYDSKGKQANLYLNGEKIEGQYGNYPALNTLKDGDVLKVMTADAASHDVSYTLSGIDADKVVVRHDHMMTVDHSASHNVFAGTAVHIEAADGASIAVKANDDVLEADENGVFAHTVAGNVNFVITDASAVADIAVDATDADNTIYNLQGVPVGTDLNALPAGLYISAGKKVVKK